MIDITLRAVLCTILLAQAGTAQQLAAPTDAAAGANSLPIAFAPLADVVAKAAAPAWVKPGARLVFRVSTTDPEPPAPGKDRLAGGTMLQVFDVAGVVGRETAVVSHSFFKGLNGGLAMGGTNSTWEVAGGNANWLNPDLLAKAAELAKDPKARLSVADQDVLIDGQTYKTQVFVLLTDRDRTSIAVDRASGVFVRQLYSKLVDGQQRPAYLSELVSMRQVELKGSNADVPGWVAQTPKLKYAGTKTKQIPGAFPYVTEVKVDYSLQKIVGRIAIYKSTMVATGIGGGTSELMYFSMPGVFGGPWVAPELLADLKAEQVLDREPGTGGSLTVDRVWHTGDGRAMVTLSETAPGYSVSSSYDRASGALMSVKIVNGEMFDTVEVTYQGNQ